MKKIVAVNAGPRKNWNTAQLIKAACEGAEAAGAKIEYVDMYELDKYSGCVSCFGCKREGNFGHCVCRDGLTPVLEAIREADGLIVGTPNYLNETTAAFRALYERLIFQFITYKKEFGSYNTREIPVLFIMTSNSKEEKYKEGGAYHYIVESYRKTFNGQIGPTEILIAGDTLQVDDYSIYDWTMFDPEHKKKRRDEEFPKKLSEAREMGKKMTE